MFDCVSKSNKSNFEISDFLQILKFNIYDFIYEIKGANQFGSGYSVADMNAWGDQCNATFHWCPAGI